MQDKSETRKKLARLMSSFKGTSAESLLCSIINHLECSLAKDEYTATPYDSYQSLSLAVRDRLAEHWINTKKTYYQEDPKRVYYLSLEFLIGRTLGNSLINMDLYNNSYKALMELGYELEELRELEWDAGLGNGGLGRLAACFMDSLATLEIPAFGYGIRYEYGIFFQSIKDGYQVESPDNWLRRGNVWEFPRPEYLYSVKFYGRVNQYSDSNGRLKNDWIDTEEVLAMAYDVPVPGYRNNTVNNLRLWSAKSSRDFNFEYFNHGDYARAITDKAHSENISMVLYPNDNIFEGKELRLKQEYFFVSATLQDIIRRYKKIHSSFNEFPDKAAIQLNDTHPAIAIAELMRILIDVEWLGWDEAWSITTKTFGYTNHTILPEALEKWQVSLFERVLPRHILIIYEINRRFLEEVSGIFPGDSERLKRMSIIEESDEKRVRMANLAIVGSHSVNGVAALHSEILKESLFRDFYDIWPEKFNNKTNGITQRRWLKLCNPGLSNLISSRIGDGWINDLYRMRALVPLSAEGEFQTSWRTVKRKNKEAFRDYIRSHNNIEINIDSIFDCHVKRLHEYKRQLLNVLHVITLYNRIKAAPGSSIVPRTIIFSGKAAPGYYMAKLIIKLINSIADIVNNDPDLGNKLKVVFLRNYAVSNAEKIIPAADLSEQISTAGTEASGTGNMKFALNGALTIGTLDGANIEIMEEVGGENIFIFGLNAGEAANLRNSGYNPYHYYENNSELRQAIDMIKGGYFSPFDKGLFVPITDSLLYNGDRYMLLADYESYVKCQEMVSSAYRDEKKWTRMSILNVAGMGKFSTDRTIKEYAEEIWNAKPVTIKIKDNDKNQL